MSKSFKKHPYAKDSQAKRWAKRYANKKVRRYIDHIAHGNSYRKVSQSYEICDYCWHWTLKDAQRKDLLYPNPYYSCVDAWYRMMRK